METKDFNNIHMGDTLGGGSFNTKNVIEDFMKTEYQEGLRNEFNMMDALINKLPKDTITGKVKYKSFALGITDNVRAVGSGTYDRYELGFEDFYGKGTDTVEAQFDTTKLMATFAITDEAILKGTGDGSLIDVLKDSLSRMEIGLKHTYNRYIYGGHKGIIGKLSTKKNQSISAFTLSSSEGDEHRIVEAAKTDSQKLMDYRGEAHNKFYGNAPTMVTFAFTNSHSLIEGMGCMVQIGQAAANGIATDSTVYVPCKRLVGRIWQKDNTDIHSEKVIMVVEASYSSDDGKTWAKDSSVALGSVVSASTGSSTAKATEVAIYSRQLVDTKNGIADEYHGLEDIVITKNNKIFGVDRSVYRSLNCTQVNLKEDTFLNEEILRDLSDHLALTSPDGTAVSLVCANHRIISQVEKALYQFKNYNITNVSQGMQLGGGAELRFDNYVLYKDKYARDNNVYMLDQAKIGELVRRDFTWITSGEVNGVLQRRPGTEMYEGIMNKYADMYIDAWRCHAAIKNCKVVEPGTFFSYGTDGQAKPL